MTTQTQTQEQKKAFVDESPFCGWKEYFDENGVAWRRKDRSCSFQFFALENGSFLPQGSLDRRGLKRASIKTVHNKFLDYCEEEEENDSTDFTYFY